MGFKGIDVRQTGDRIVFRASLKDSAGDKLSTGTTSLYLFELQNDGTLKSYDFNDNTFKTTALTTDKIAMTHRTGNNSTYSTGVWTYSLTTVSGFTIGNVYIAQVLNTGALPPYQEREWQYGSEQGDVVATATGTGTVAIVAQLADGLAHGGTPGSSTATLALKQMQVVAQDANTSAVIWTGLGSGSGWISTGGATGSGAKLRANSGIAAFDVRGGYGAIFIGSDSSGIYAEAGGNSHAGLYLAGNAAFSTGLNITSNFNAVNIQGGGTGVDLNLAGLGFGSISVNGSFLATNAANDIRGVKLAASGVDSIIIATGIKGTWNLRQAINTILAVEAGLTGGAGTSSETYYDAADGTTVRLVGGNTAGSNGEFDRTSATYTIIA